MKLQQCTSHVTYTYTYIDTVLEGHQHVIISVNCRLTGSDPFFGTPKKGPFEVARWQTKIVLLRWWRGRSKQYEPVDLIPMIKQKATLCQNKNSSRKFAMNIHIRRQWLKPFENYQLAAISTCWHCSIFVMANYEVIEVGSSFLYSLKLGYPRFFYWVYSPSNIWQTWGSRSGKSSISLWDI